MVIDKEILDALSKQAKGNSRLRQVMDLRNSPEDLSQRMLNALEPGTVIKFRCFTNGEGVASYGTVWWII